MKKQPQQPEQQRSDYSASALSERPDRASGDRGLVTASLVRLLMIRRFDAQADHIDENAAALRKWADTEHEARCRELCASYLREMANTLRVEQKIADLDEALRSTDSAVGHDASSEPRQNETNAVVQDEPEGWVSVKERLPEQCQSVALVNVNRWENCGGDMERNIHDVGFLDGHHAPWWSIRGDRAQTLDAYTHWMPLPAPPKVAETK
jgi:hypothetical protein